MKRLVMSLTSASILLSGAIQANDMQEYIITAPEADVVKPMTAIAGSVYEQFSRLQAIDNINLNTATDASLAGVEIKSQLNILGPISFASMTKEQVAILEAQGYQIDTNDIVSLYGYLESFPGISTGVPEREDASLYADTVPYGIALVEADKTWNEASGAGVKTCIIDTGLDTDHPDLASNYMTGTGTTGGSSPEDGNGHGTHVAGTVAGNLNGSGIVGVAPEASLYISRVFGSSGSTTQQAILEGLEWCVEQGTRTANMSYGGPSSNNAAERAYQAAYDAGLVMVAATGNSGARAPIGYPAAYDTTIAVGATDSRDRIASFSQRGPAIDLVAPGVAVNSAANGGGTRNLSGTSMATPHVTGAVAAILSVNPNLSVEDVRSLLRDTADDLGPAGFDNTFGAGRLNVRSAIDALGSGGGNRPPSAAFGFDADLLTVSFSDDSSDSDGVIVSWDWDFGDGSSSSAQNPTYTYSANGDYTVTLTVTDDDGASRSTSQTVSVNDGTLPNIEASVSTGGFWIFTTDTIRWDGARTSSVDIYRDGRLFQTTANDGAFTTGLTWGRSFTYQVCEAGSTSACSAEVN